MLLCHPELLDSRHMFLELLPKVAYMYSSGPFKGLLVRHGYDPEKEPKSRFLQLLTIRLPHDIYNNLKQR